jgi:hypothetical protein
MGRATRFFCIELAAWGRCSGMDVKVWFSFALLLKLIGKQMPGPSWANLKIAKYQSQL